jgi:putative membrane protein insertion efficiency factor
VKHVLIAVMKAYRAVVSPLYGQVCKFHPTCSAYALEALEVHGAAKGSWLAMRRLVRCHPWSLGGYDPVPGSERESRWLARLEAEERSTSGAAVPSVRGIS